MKATALQAKPPNERVRRASGEAVRGEGSRRRCTGQHIHALESQANEMSSRVLRGETDLAQRIGRTTVAANFRNAASPGSPLTGSIRERMESSFGADFSSVRIHTNAAASKSAREEGAYAFTSGSEIYFAFGRFSPQTEAGIRLLAHELTHVLQQTSRASVGKKRTATPMSGLGAIQLHPDDDPYTDDKVAFLSSNKTAFDELASRHTAGKGADESLKLLIEVVRSESGGSLPQKDVSTIGEILIAIAETGSFGVPGETTLRALTPAATGFLVDCLKVCGLDEHFEAAAKLLDNDKKFEIKTAFGARKDFREYLRKDPRDEEWILEAFHHDPLKQFWDFLFINTFHQFVFNPFRPIQSLYRFADAKKTALENINAEKPDLLWSDRVLMAFPRLQFYDSIRLHIFSNIEESVAKERPNDSLTRRRMYYGAKFYEVLQKPLPVPVARSVAQMFEKWKAIARQAQLFWLKVVRFQDTILDTLRKTDKATLYEGFIELDRPFAEDDPFMAPLHDALLKIRAPGGLFFLNDVGTTDLNNIPSPEVYQTRIAAVVRAIDLKGQAGNNFLLAIQQALVEQQTKNQIDSPKALALGWVLHWLSDFEAVLNSYSAKRDDAKFADGRLAHRYALSNALLILAQVAKWQDVRDMAAVINRGADVVESYLAVPGQWEVDPKAPVAGMLKDFPGDPIIAGYGGLRASHAAAFFQGSFLESMAKTIEVHLEKARRGPKEDVDMDALTRQLETLPRPWRCKPDNTAVVVITSEDIAGGLSNADLIDRSPRTKAELDRLIKVRGLGARGKWLASLEPGITTPLIAWIVPELMPIITMLKSFAPLKDRMTKAGFQHLPEVEWLEKLIALSGATAHDDLFKAIDAHVHPQAERYIDAVRQFTSLRRRLISGQIEQLLDKYKNTAHKKKFGEQAVDKIWHFKGQVPFEVADRQHALMVLGLGAQLNSKFDTLSRVVTIPPHFHETLTATLAIIPEFQKATAAGAADADRRFVNDVLFRNDIDPSRAEKIEDFLANEQNIKELADRMEEARLEMQMEHGFQSTDGETLMSLRSNEKIKPGPEHAMEIGGDDWELVEVKRKFTYHPELGMSASTSKAKDPILKLDGDDKPVPIENQELAVFLINGNEKVVVAGMGYLERKEMSELSSALFYHTLSIEMGELADTLEGGARLIMEVVELIPGYGQAAMVAKIAGMIGTFLGEVPELAEALSKNPLANVKTLADKLTKESLAPEKIIMFFLLGEGIEPLNDRRRPTPAPPRVRPKGKLAKAINIVRRIGMKIADALRWLRLRIEGPMRSLQSSIVTRPRLAWLLLRALDVASWIRQITQSDDPALGVTTQQRRLAALEQLLPIGAEPPENATEDERKAHSERILANTAVDIAKGGEFFKVQLDELLNKIKEAQLPKEVVPLKVVMEFLIDFFIGRLGAKVRLIRSLVEHTDAYRDLKGAIASGLAVAAEGTDLDPNVLWRKYVLDAIDAQFLDARNRLIGGIYERTNEIADATGLSFFRIPQPDKPTNYGLQRTDYEKELYSIEGKVPARGRLAEVPLTEGQPLATSVRLVEERRFGHDFGHVRLHEGSDSEKPLQEMGANALTTGSHVFLRPGLDPRVGLGAHVLRHELTHVLQQTGPRPRGKRYETRPVRGRRGVGVTVDQMREAAAETMANLDAAAIAREPVDVDAGAEGIQPSFDGPVQSLLTWLTTVQSSEDFDKPTGGKAVPGEVDARVAWRLVHGLLKSEKFKHEDFVKDVVSQISAHVIALVSEDDIPKVAALAQAPAPKARGKKPKKTVLDFQRFIALLEGFIFTETGISMQIEITDPPSTLKSVKVTYVHFGFISPTSATGKPLWDSVMKSTNGLGGTDDQVKLRSELYARLRSLGPDPFVWKTGEAQFRFSEEFVEAFNKVRVHGRKPTLEKELPIAGPRPDADPNVKPEPKDKYLNPSGTKGIGLRTGIHRGQQGTDRESHHTTQYLLIQYFGNNNSVPAWLPRVDYPGISPKTGKDRNAFRTNGKTLEINSLAGSPSSRGSEMPAVLVSADLHKRGRLHVERETQWTGKEGDPDSEDDQGGSTRQGYAIDRVFKQALKTKFGVRDSESGWADAVKAKGDKAAPLIHEAMLETYHWMRNLMIPALEKGLMTRELAYYRGVAARLHLDKTRKDKLELQADYNLTVDDMRAIFNRARANNDSVMKAAGWTV